MNTNGRGQIWALVAAAGSGSRMGLGFNKQYAELQGMPILRHTLLAFSSHPSLDGIIVLVAPGEEEEFQSKIKLPPGVPLQLVTGGVTRQESVYKGLQALEKIIPKDIQAQSLVLIHDGARPLVKRELIDKLIAEAVKYKAVAPGIPPRDTIKVVDDYGVVKSTLNRESLRLVQTPQVFSLPLILEAHLAARERGFNGTDDCQLVEGIGQSVHLIVGDPENIKVTVPVDLTIAQALEGEKRKMRIGHGYDVHRLVSDRPLVLGGVTIPYTQGLLGHSDADVLLHAIGDALLGAAKLGDLGKLFPDTDPAYKDANSMDLLKRIAELLAEKNYFVINVDLTVALERPKLASYRAQMEENIASCLKINQKDVSVKATTTEGLGFVGKGEGIAAWAVVLLEGRDDKCR